LLLKQQHDNSSFQKDLQGFKDQTDKKIAEVESTFMQSFTEVRQIVVQKVSQVDKRMKRQEDKSA